jgi:hypothetical protein
VAFTTVMDRKIKERLELALRPVEKPTLGGGA